MIILGPVAVADNLVIGGDNNLPWHLPEDLQNFKKLTLGKTVLMGRKTYESIVSRLGKPLPGRKSVVITRQKDFKATVGVSIYHDLTSALTELSHDDVYVIGGAEIFKLALPLAELMYMTHVHGSFKGDAFFPAIDWSNWEKLAEDKHEKFSFAKYKRKNT